MKDRFNQRKKSVLKKADKSSVGGWDERVIKLCEKINSLEEYYTTSSCSGRVMVLKDQDKKGRNVFVFVSHDLVREDFLKNVELKGNLKFKQEPFIFHVACRDLEGARKLIDKAHSVGWKRAGVISLGKNIIVEINGNEKIDFPLVKKGKLLVSEEFMKISLERANFNLEKNWDKIEKLGKEF
jgi:tRNA wybutosine-synthesizing protein 3